MTVCDKKSLDFVNVIFQISHIRDDQIDSVHVILRKRQTAIHNNNTVLIFCVVMFIPNLLQSSKFWKFFFF